MLTEPEQWKPVVGFEGLYEVSDQGRVRSLPRVVAVVGGVINSRRVPEKTLSPALNSHGYPHVTLFRDGIRWLRLVHRLVLEAFHGPCPEGCESLHSNGVRDDAAASNLRWGSKVENAADRDAHGNTVRGESKSNAKLTEEEVVRIRAAYGTTSASLGDLAGKYDVCSTTIWNVVKEKSWAHVGQGDSL